MRQPVARGALWCVLCAACPAAVTTVFLRPALLFLAYSLGAAGVVVPAHLLVRGAAPAHRYPPRHARAVDMEARLRIADAEQQLHGYEKFFVALGLREAKTHRWEPRVINGGDDQEGDPGTKAGLARPAAVLLVV